MNQTVSISEQGKGVFHRSFQLHFQKHRAATCTDSEGAQGQLQWESGILKIETDALQIKAVVVFFLNYSKLPQIRISVHHKSKVIWILTAAQIRH